MTSAQLPCVLIVDDEEAVLFSYAAIFRHAGYRTLEASTETAALDLLIANDFDLLVCDWALDGRNTGLGVIEAVLEKNHHIPVILMSGYADLDLPPDVKKANLTIVNKPADIPALLDTMRKLLAAA